MGKHIIIQKARCSFPRLYGSDDRDGQTFGPGITLVLESDAHARVLEDIKTEMKKVIVENQKLKKNPPSGERLCLREADRDELKYKPGNLILKANCKQPPIVLHPDGKTIMTEADDKIYSGCYVNAKIEIWGQANQYGRRVNAKLLAVQYVPIEAPSFDGSYVSPEVAAEGFSSLDDGLDDSGAGDSLLD